MKLKETVALTKFCLRYERRFIFLSKGPEMKLSNMTSLFIRKQTATSLFPSSYFLPNQIHSKRSSNAPPLEITVVLILIDGVSDQWVD